MLTDEQKKKKEKLNEQCDRFLEQLYKEVDGYRMQHADWKMIGEILGYTYDEILKVIERLQTDGNAKQAGMGTEFDITHDGILYIESKLNTPEIINRQKDRMTYLNNLYSETDGNLHHSKYFTALGFDEENSKKIAIFLMDEGLIAFESNHVKLTDYGLQTVENSETDILELDDLPTPFNINLNVDKIINSALQINSPGSTQILNISDSNVSLNDIKSITEVIETLIESVDATTEDKTEVGEKLQEIIIETKKNKPNIERIKQSFNSIFNGVLGNIIFALLMTQYPKMAEMVSQLISSIP